MSDFTFHPLAPERWQDFEQLFGPRGACAGCWCMFWKRRGKKFDAFRDDPHRAAQKEFVEAGGVPGLLAYAGGDPVGWIAVEPRRAYERLAFSKVLAPVDDEPVWSVTCFFVARSARGQGLSVALLQAAIRHVAGQGGHILEGYPTDLRPGQDASPAFIYTGTASAFLRAGFVEVTRRSPTRPIMRHVIQ